MDSQKIIVIDDNLVSRILPGFILRSFGLNIQVFEFDNGLNAMHLLKTHQIKYVLLDISMPEMDGINVAAKIRADTEISNVRLIAYTADALLADVIRFKSFGFDDFLLKPLKSSELFRVLDIHDRDDVMRNY